MALLTTQQVGLTGLHPTYDSADAVADTVAADPRTFLHIRNANAGTVTVTVTTTQTVSGLDVEDVSVATPTGEERFIGPLGPASLLADSAGLVTVTCAPNASVTLAALRI